LIKVTSANVGRVPFSVMINKQYICSLKAMRDLQQTSYSTKYVCGITKQIILLKKTKIKKKKKKKKKKLKKKKNIKKKKNKKKKKFKKNKKKKKFKN